MVNYLNKKIRKLLRNLIKIDRAMSKLDKQYRLDRQKAI